MTALGRLVFPFASTPHNYAASLQKLTYILVYELLLIQTILYTNTPLGSQVGRAASWLSLDQVVVALDPAYPPAMVTTVFAILVAVLVGAFANFIQLHDRLSDLFGIRRRFDKACILYPLALLTGTHLDEKTLNLIEANRRTLMHRVFYRHASSRADDALVDKHDIEHALSAWAWYWVFLEGLALLPIAVLSAYIVGSPYTGLFFAAWFLLYLILAAFQYNRLERYARPQVEQIARNRDAAADVKDAFDAL